MEYETFEEWSNTLLNELISLGYMDSIELDSFRDDYEAGYCPHQIVREYHNVVISY